MAMSTLAIDTSVVVAVIAGEQERDALIAHARGMALVAPNSVHWEVGNALAAMLKRHRAILDQILQMLAAFHQVPIRFVDVNLAASVRLAAEHGLYAYDAYLIACAREQRCPLLTLDDALARAARAAGVELIGSRA